MLYDLLVEKWAAMRQGHPARHNKAAGKQGRRGNSRLRVEPLEDRQMLSISSFGLAAVHAASHAAGHAASSAVTVALQDRPSTSSYGQSVSLIATVTGATTGSVEFFDNGSATPLGTANVSTRGVADYITNTLPLGTNSITAEYFAAGASAASATSTAIPETVNAASTRTVVSAPSNPIVAGASVTFTATVSSGGAAGQRACRPER